MKLPTPQQIERRAARAGLTVKQLCDLAEISYVTFWKWRIGRTSPQVSTVQRLLDALDRQAAQ